MQQNQLDEFKRLKKVHAEKVQEYNEIKEQVGYTKPRAVCLSEFSIQVRRDLLKNVEIIGCTTTGAAKLGSLLKSLSPKVLMVEEAGQVLEAHILGSLVPSVEHLILIGDPLQLRPTLNNFALSVEHPRGSQLYRFDMSLMERLATSGLPMSRIDVQRRMRPTISSLIRNTLYEGLQDHELVKSYPDVRGMVKNLFFVTHNHRENGGMDDTASKYNVYEVRIQRYSRLLFPRQGCYSAEGDIVVLCAYLGQLARLRDALGGEVAVVIDERDQAALDDREGDKEDASDDSDGPSIQHVKVTSCVRLRTVDNYQGEEGKVVILSLVRNSGGDEDEVEMQTVSQHTKVNIGFLKVHADIYSVEIAYSLTHCSAVALSRAREGLYIFGNADNLSSRSRMWRSIIEELDAQDALGKGLPVACHRHPERVEYISRPGQLSRIAPDGGCMEQCDTLLKCGHLCPFKSVPACSVIATIRTMLL
ncbi:P-loop containing nucleoside triphosphate hydrolase protein [Butyriboletus roseoflavus]|nr:P-loop containing nucleoside triphosphate hydrolase protein [Butyriboletus roseoflavus]